MNDELTNSELRDRIGNIDQIRDILFGSYLRDYNNRLEQIEKSLSVMQQEIRERTDEVKQVVTTELQAGIDNLEKKLRSFVFKDEQDKLDLGQQVELLKKKVNSSSEDTKNTILKQLDTEVDLIEKKIKSFVTKDEDEKIDLRQQIERLNKRVTTNFDNLDEAIDQQVNSLRDDLLSSREKIQEDVLNLRNQIFTELDRRISLLTDVKIAKDDMAELLFELGLRLKGTEFVPKLREAADSSSESSSGFILP